jgi:hypothetical protein
LNAALLTQTSTVIVLLILSENGIMHPQVSHA